MKAQWTLFAVAIALSACGGSELESEVDESVAESALSAMATVWFPTQCYVHQEVGTVRLYNGNSSGRSVSVYFYASGRWITTKSYWLEPWSTIYSSHTAYGLDAATVYASGPMSGSLWRNYCQ